LLLFVYLTAINLISTLSLHDALPICSAFLGLAAHATHFVTLFAMAGLLVLFRAFERGRGVAFLSAGILFGAAFVMKQDSCGQKRSEEHTSELQSRGHLVFRLLLEKKK